MLKRTGLGGAARRNPEAPVESKPTRGDNFAVGGARTEIGPQSLRAQVDQYVKRPKPSGHTLYIVCGGANDIFAAIGQPNALSELDAAALSLKRVLAELVAHGALISSCPIFPMCTLPLKRLSLVLGFVGRPSSFISGSHRLIPAMDLGGRSCSFHRHEWL